MGAVDDLFDDSSMDLDVGPAPPKPSRFQPKIKGKGKVKAEPLPSPSQTLTPPPSASECIPHSDELLLLKDSHAPHCNGTVVPEVAAESSSMDVVEEEDVVVREFDVYINPSLDADTKLYDMQYPLRPYWRPYEMDERCDEVRMKPKLSHFEIQLNLDVERDENYNKQDDDSLMITTQTLSSSSKSSVNEFAVGVLRGNRFHVNPLHAVVQFRPLMNHAHGVQKVKQGGHQLEPNLKPAENIKESVKMPNNMGKVVKEDAKEANGHIEVDEPWVLLDYHGSDSLASHLFQEKALTIEKNHIPFAMKPPDYLYSFGPATSACIRKTAGPSRRFLLTKPLEDRLKQWLSEGSQVNHFNALIHLAPTESLEDIFRVLQHHAYLVQGLWVSKSSLLHDGLAALFRDYILLQFSKSYSVHDTKLKIVRPEELRRNLLKPLAVERPLFNDWKFKEGADSLFIKQYPEIVKEQENAWSIREKEISESLPGGGRGLSSMLKNSVNLGPSSKAVGSIDLGRDRYNARNSVANLPTKGQEGIAKAILELLRAYKVLSLNSIIQGLQGKSNAGLPEIENVADQIAVKVHDIYVLKSSGKPDLDQFRNVVIEYFIGKGRNAKVKKQEIKLAAQYRLKRDVSDTDYGLVMNELCMSSGGSWVLKNGALR